MSEVDRALPSAVPVSRARVIATVLLTLLVVTTEFLLLNAVYHRAGPVREQRVSAAGLSGALTGRDGAINLGVVRRDVRRLSADGASAGDLDDVRTALKPLAAQPTQHAAVARLRSAARSLSAHLAAEQHDLDRQADLSYVGLLLLASVGWMFWFRRLAARHRELQRRVTEHEAHAAGERRMAALVRNSADIIAIMDPDSTISYVTPSVEPVLGRRPEQLIGHRWLDEVVDAGDTELLVLLMAGHRDGEERPIVMRAHNASGRELRLEGTLTSLLGDPAVRGLVLTVRDVTDRRELEHRLAFQAFHDPLTGLANRQLFADRLDHARVRPRRENDAGLVVVYLDLDDFKQINDSVGHSIGDAVLTVVATRLLDTVWAGDTVARLGGDEFAVLMEDATLEDGRRVADRVSAALEDPIVVEGTAHRITASVGLVDVAPDAASGAEILRNADVAMYRAKEQGRGHTAVYEPRLHALALDRLQLQTDLARAIDADGLTVHFQALVDLDTDEVVGFEALARWQHPERGLLPPYHFIPLAEQCGLVVPLGIWVLRAACRAAVSMQINGAMPSMSVNVAASQLIRPTFVAEVYSALADSGLSPDLLCLEITESSLVRDLAAVGPKLAELRAWGVRIALDDFGTGYSSLSYLARLPIDVLKVDKSFIDRVTLGGQESAVTQAILTMSQSMNLVTVAEGIEEADQAGWLSEAGCALGQGYLWSRPVPLEAAGRLLDLPHNALPPPRSGHGGRIRVNHGDSAAATLDA